MLPMMLSVALTALTAAPTPAGADAAALPMVVRFVTSIQGREPIAHLNVCVDRIKARDLEQARPSCDQAVREAHRLQLVEPVAHSGHDRRDARALAAAFSNRAVLELLSGNFERAQAEIMRAKRLAPSEPFVVRNVRVIERAIRAVRTVVRS